MKVINVYECYFAASCVFNDVPRRAAVVRLTATSDAGEIRYDVSVSFFPHVDEEDFAISYDAYAEQTVYEGKGRRSKKRDEALLESLQETADALAASLGGEIDWSAPLIEVRRG